MANKECSFCASKEGVDTRLIAGERVFICEHCVISAYKIFFGDTEEEEKSSEPIEQELLTPKQLKTILDKFVIGQERAKKVFSVGIYNHYKRIFKQTDVEDSTEIAKSNILLVGPTGSGKTLMAQTMAKFLDVPIAICDATSLTEAGYVGEDVENILTKLLQVANWDIKKAEQGIVFIDEVDKVARMSENRSITRDVSGEGVQQALLKIIEGSVVNIPPKGGRKHPNQDFLQINTVNILFICGGAFDGLEDIIKRRVGQNVLGFDQEKRAKSNDIKLLKTVEPDDLVHYGLIPELIGRLHILATLDEISEDEMVRILVEPQNAILKQYKKLFAIDNVELNFEDEALKEIATLAIKRKTGARGLRTIMEEIMIDVMYELPELDGYEIMITKDVVVNGEKPLYIKKNRQSA
ncbi:MAG: ATP-dependent Clp protease ATP-binding subunit ClpX [Sulfurospirillum sp.]|nr:ATP-dependent Clp protease ATP-binding subunit ClpX [Sulfurospirillum sp.]MBL0702463.1 ATP-dependent Clp protease ATP-binding subunit ClpX [Sulfurospirillum sp.]